MSSEDPGGIMGGLLPFLRAELEKDQDVAHRNLGERGLGIGYYPDYRTHVGADTEAADAFIERFNAERTLREIDAKRGLALIVELALADDPDDQTAQHMAAHLVMPFSEHPGYRAGWSMIDPSTSE